MTRLSSPPVSTPGTRTWIQKHPESTVQIRALGLGDTESCPQKPPGPTGKTGGAGSNPGLGGYRSQALGNGTWALAMLPPGSREPRQGLDIPLGS